MKSRIKVKPRVRSAAAPAREAKESQSSPNLTVCLFITGQEPPLSGLESLKPLLKTISSELIVTHFDTLMPSEDTPWMLEAQSLAARFAVAPWTDDGFSAVWNKGIQEARGKWILFLKEEEVLKAPAEIRSFLLSKEAGAYSQGWLRVLSETGEEVWADRLFLRTPELQFRFPVFERPIAAPGSRKLLKETVLRDSSKRESIPSVECEKIQALLQRQAETDEPKATSLRAMAYLAWKAHQEGNSAEAEEFCRRVLSSVTDTESDELDGDSLSLRGWACAGIIRETLSRGENQKAWEEGPRLLSYCPQDSLEEACLRFLLMKTADALSLPESALEQGKRYWECLRALDLSLDQQEPGVKTIPDMPGLEEAVRWSKRLEALCDHVRLNAETGRTGDAFQCCSRLPWEICAEDARTLLSSWGLLLEMSRKQKQYDTLKDCLRRVKGIPQWMAARAEQEKDLHPEEALELTGALAEIADPQKPEPYLLYQQVLLLKPDDKDQAIYLLNLCANLHVRCTYPYQGIVLACLRYDLIPVTFCLDMEWEEWLDCVRFNVELCKPEEIPAILSNLEQRNYIHALPFLALPMALQVKRLTEYPPQTLEEAREALKSFRELSQEYMTKRFRKELMDKNNWSLLPKICRMGLHVDQAFKMEELRLPAKARLEGENAISILPEMRAAFAPLLAQWEEEENTAELSAKKEFYLLAQQAKAEVIRLLALRQFEEAEKVLEELETMLPDDPSLERLKKQAASLLPSRT